MAERDDIGTVPPQADRSMSGLLSALTREASRLFRQEIALARAEIADKLGQLGTGAAEMIAGGFILYGGFLVLLAAAVLGLAQVLPPWLAAVVVGVVTVLVGAGVLFKGRRDVRPRSLVPDRTIRTLRDDAEWAREQMR
jgi:putative superfamily III holin-X